MTSLPMYARLCQLAAEHDMLVAADPMAIELYQIEADGSWVRMATEDVDSDTVAAFEAAAHALTCAQGWA